MRGILFNVAIAINILLAFLLIFENYLQVPLWLQVFGRIHPLFLHIPIGILILYALLELLSSFKSIAVPNDIKDFLLLVSAVTVSLTALMGLFLGREEGYEADALMLHKWAGAITSFLLLAWYAFREPVRRNALLDKLIATLSIVVVTITGHFGGNITHGENFVMGPVSNSKRDVKQVAFDEAVVYTDMVHPIIEEKCLSCHNQRKAKGELIMETAELMTKGGKNGKLWDTTANDLGLMISRIHLPMEHDDHMPPKGKPQLTEAEKTILESWVKSGSDFNIRVADLAPSDTLRVLAEAQFNKPGEEVYTFEKADDKVVSELNNFYRVVKPLSENSPALDVIFFGPSKFDPQGVQQLKPVETQVVQVDLSRMPVGDSVLQVLSNFANLRKLNLSFTKVKGNGLQQLQKLEHLKELSLSGTSIDAAALNVLKDFPSLEKVFLWNTPLSKQQVASLQKQDKDIHYETGFAGDTLVLKLTPPILENEDFVLTEPARLLLRHNINGAMIRYTMDGSEPDSVKSPLYDGKAMIDKDVLVKAKVFRDGWISSDTKAMRFYRSTMKPAESRLLNQPHSYHKAMGVATLFDKTLSGVPKTGGTWLGYHYPEPFELEMDLGKPVDQATLTLSVVTEPGAYVVAPEWITVQYGKEKGKLTGKATLKPLPPKKDEKPANPGYSFQLKGSGIRYIRVEAMPVKHLPTWISEKHDPGWVFVDEVILN